MWPFKSGETGKIQVAWETDLLVAVITAVGVPVEEALLDIGMNYKIAVIYL